MAECSSTWEKDIKHKRKKYENTVLVTYWICCRCRSGWLWRKFCGVKSWWLEKSVMKWDHPLFLQRHLREWLKTMLTTVGLRNGFSVGFRAGVWWDDRCVYDIWPNLNASSIVIKLRIMNERKRQSSLTFVVGALLGFELVGLWKLVRKTSVLIT